MTESETMLTERTAYHEAGHIFMHLQAGIELTVACINEHDKKYNVFIHDNYDLVQYDNKDMRDNKIMCIRAGSLAEQYYCLRNCIKDDIQISGNDLWQISRIYHEGKHKFNCYASFDKYIKRLEVETERLIKIHWSFVEIIAQNLLTEKRLTADQINELWKNHLANK
jgi:hypothetical protein